MLTARGDALDLHQGILGQGGDLHAAAGGILVEILGIDLVHGAKIPQVLHKDRGFDNIVQGQTGFGSTACRFFRD